MWSSGSVVCGVVRSVVCGVVEVWCVVWWKCSVWCGRSFVCGVIGVWCVLCGGSVVCGVWCNRLNSVYCNG